ncbi:MAG: plasmid recombination protein [Ruminococcus sp.]|nr:plasmid recombination protein [Ruminococcus sp.]
MSKTISMCQGKGSLSHNNREFTAKNIDPSRTPDNIIFKQPDLSEAYLRLFDVVIAVYNAKQKRNDRKIPDYFQHLFNREPSKSVITGANKQKSFYEDLVQIGTKDDTGVGTPDAEVAVACLKEYMEDFQERNPNFYVFNAVMHLDEATPHLHIDYIPLGHFFNGLEKRNAMARALEEMGYGKGANAINRWSLAEWKVLHDICTKHGLEISEPKKSRGYSYTVEEYGEHEDEIRRLNEEKAQALSERDEAQAELEKIAQKRVNELIAQLVNILSELIEAHDPEQVPEVSTGAVEMLTVKECTEAVRGLSEHTVRKLIKQGKLPYLRTGDGVNGKMLINKADLLAYFNGQTANR